MTKMTKAAIVTRANRGRNPSGIWEVEKGTERDNLLLLPPPLPRESKSQPNRCNNNRINKFETMEPKPLSS